MASAEEIFNSTKLEVIVPDEPLEIPAESEGGADWLLALGKVRQRDKAFFDERLLLFFTVRIPHPVPEPVDDESPASPPLALAQFLSRLQVTLDAKYVLPHQQAQRQLRVPAGRGISLALPPRSYSHHKASRLGELPSIFPPQTPNPTPQTDEADRQYASSSARMEGTVLESFVWGETQREDPTQRNFALLWSSSANAWIAVYRLHIGVSFLSTPAPEPVLSLTVSATLREKPLKMTPERQALAALLRAAKGIQTTTKTTELVTAANGSKDETSDREDTMDGLEEVNLLDGLSQSSTFGGPNDFSLKLPSVRFAASFRRSAFSLPPTKPTSPLLSAPSMVTSPSDQQSRKPTPVLRKSFLKTLRTVSGFQIRMKSVFVPYVVISGTAEDEDERREAGAEERTVVLSVELGNNSESRAPGATGFAVEGVDVIVGGEGATAHLISWGENGLNKSDGIFPIFIRPSEHYNVLYAITFLRQSEQDDVADSMRNGATGKLPSPTGEDMQRAVSIFIRGRPFESSADTYNTRDTKNLFYPTQLFQSRWNCVLDLISVSQNEILSQNFDVTVDPPSAQDSLPAPPSPFPAATPKAKMHVQSPHPMSAAAGSKRHTIATVAERGLRTAIPNLGYRASTSTINNFGGSAASPSSPAGSKFSPSRANDTPPPSARLRTPPAPIPPTPAYPAYPSDAVPPIPPTQSPITKHQIGGGSGPAVEPHRERKIIPGGAPQTPGPRMIGVSFADKAILSDEEEDDGETVIVSVGLVSSGDRAALDQGMIYALDTFGLEIFVFNRGERAKRFEVSFPDRKRRRYQSAAAEASAFSNAPSATDSQSPGILPLENRIRVGPLRPHTCQSVRMLFLALRPGVHSIHSLILTDVETGYSKNLKSVMDVVVRQVDES